MTAPSGSSETSASNRIETSIQLNSPRSRVFQALTTSKEFGTWFGAAFDGEFVPGQLVGGQMLNAGYTHVRIEFLVETITPETHFSFRWHPYAIDMSHDYSGEERTLVEFTLDDVGGGTFLTVTESGFEFLPASRRAKAFEMNSGGWTSQLKRIAKYVDPT